MKKRNRGKPETRQLGESPARKRSATQSDHHRKWWPQASMEELIGSRLGSPEKAALAAEYAVCKQPPACLSEIVDSQWDMNGGH